METPNEKISGDNIWLGLECLEISSCRLVGGDNNMAWIIEKEPTVFLKHSPSLGLNNLTANASNFVSGAL